jgi:hypothetical protein
LISAPIAPLSRVMVTCSFSETLAIPILSV